ncbi:MAG: hypothetical protein AAGL89_14570, partial [Pseudomonadota bacterium]
FDLGHQCDRHQRSGLMLSVGLELQSQLPPGASGPVPVSVPAGFGWDTASFPLAITRSGNTFSSGLTPRDLVNPAIWTGPAFHVDPAADDSNSGLGAMDGDFSDAKRTIYGAFVAGNATGAPYRIIVKAGQYEGSALTRNGKDEPNQPVAIIAHGGRVHYRTGPFSTTWSDAGGTASASVSSVRRVFRTDILTSEGFYTELEQVADVATCAATAGSWVLDGSTVHVNVGGVPGAGDIALMRSFHGARFLTHTDDLYLEGLDIEGGITGALHCDPVASRNIVGVDCSFRYSAPSNPAAPQDAVRIRRNTGLAAFFGCDASVGAKDGWSFHDDGVAGMHVLLEDCTSKSNGAYGATSVNDFTLHDAVVGVSMNGQYGPSENGSDVHLIQNAQAWVMGGAVTARDTDGISTAVKCSNASQMWLDRVQLDAAGSTSNYALEVNGGTVFTRDLTIVSGTEEVTSGGSVTPF